MKVSISIIMSVLILSLGGMAGCSSNSTSTRGYHPSNIPSNIATDFQLRNLDGQVVSLSSLQGKPVLLNFWTTWCLPCREEMPLLQEVFEDGGWKDEGLVILGVDVGESAFTVAEFMRTNGYTFPVLLDVEQNVAPDYNIRSIPTTFFIDRNGIIRDVRIGAFPSKAAIESILNKIT